jgi:hypothetical protein
MISSSTTTAPMNTLTLNYSLSTNQSQLLFTFSSPLKLTAPEFEHVISIQISGMDDNLYRYQVESPPKLRSTNISLPNVYDTYNLLLSFD